MKKFILALFLLSFSCSLLKAQEPLTGNKCLGSLEGTLRDKNTDETLPFTKVALYQNDQLISGQDTDQYGDYVFDNVASGKYEIKASIYGYDFVSITEVEFTSCVSRFLDLDLEQENDLYMPVQIIEYTLPKISLNICGCGSTVVATTFEATPTWDEVVTERNLPGPAEKDPDKPPFEYSLYPNPSFGMIYIDIEFEALQIQLFDIVGHNLGEVVYQEIEKEKISLDLSGLPAGTYILQLRHDRGNHTEKVIVLGR